MDGYYLNISDKYSKDRKTLYLSVYYDITLKEIINYHEKAKVLIHNNYEAEKYEVSIEDLPEQIDHYPDMSLQPFILFIIKTIIDLKGKVAEGKLKDGLWKVSRILKFYSNYELIRDRWKRDKLINIMGDLGHLDDRNF